MRCQTCRFSSSSRNTQLATSMAVRPQPLHISSYRVEQTATQGESLGLRLCDESRCAWTVSMAPSDFCSAAGSTGVVTSNIEINEKTPGPEGHGELPTRLRRPV